MSQIVNPPPVKWNGYDYFVYIDTDDGNKYKAKNGHTGVVDFTSSTDVNAVLNSCVLALVPQSTGDYALDIETESKTGGTIFVGHGVFTFNTALLMRSRITLRGAGKNNTIFKRGAGLTNVPFIESSTWATEAFWNKYRSGDREVVLEHFTIDGNYANSTGANNDGIRKCGFSWVIRDLYIQYNSGHGIFTYCPELVGPDGAGYPNDPTNNNNSGMSWQDFYERLFINLNHGWGIYFFGPDESYITECQIALNGEGAIYNQQYGMPDPVTGGNATNPLGRYISGATSETGGTVYAASGNSWHGQGYHALIHISDTHTYANNLNNYNRFAAFSGVFAGTSPPGDPASQTATLRYPEVWINGGGTSTNCTFETSAGPSLRIESIFHVDNLFTYFHNGPAVYVRGNGSKVSFIDADYGNTDTSVKYACALYLEGSYNDISFRSDPFTQTTQAGMYIGISGTTADHNMIRASILNAHTGIIWGNGSQDGNFIEADVHTISGQSALSGSPYMETNSIHINSYGEGTNWPWNDAYMTYREPTIVNGVNPNPAGFKTTYIPTIGWQYMPYYDSPTAMSLATTSGAQTLSFKTLSSGTTFAVFTSGNAVAGSGQTLPAKPQGYINATVSGVVRYIPFY